MNVSAPTDPRGAQCAVSPVQPLGPAPAAESLPSQPLFPPKDADAETRRRWLAGSPWPEVVFAAAF